MDRTSPEIQGHEGQVPLCDLGFGPLSCFVTMKPFSCDHLAPIKTRQKADPSAVHNEHNERAGPTEWVEIGPTPKLPLEGQLGSPKKGTASPNKKFLDEPTATSLQSFSSGGSSPSWSRKWNSPKGQAIPARTLAGYKPDASKEWARSGLLEEKTASKVSDEDDRQRLLDAWSSGRIIEAKRLVQKSQSMKRRFHEILDENDLEVIHRVDASYSNSLDELAQDLDMAFRLSNDLLQAVATTVCSCDLVEALDGLLEYVQQHEHNDDLEVQQLNNEMEQDSLLRVTRSGALWLSSYTFKHRNLKFRGTRLPPPKSGAVRLSFWRSSFAIAPCMGDLKRGRSAVRVTYALARRPSSAACIFPSIMHREVGKMLTRFKEFLQNRDFERDSLSNSTIYDSIRRHAAECAANPRSREIQEVSFEELASLLPEDWADYHDPVHVNDQIVDFE
eukprot:symbB.v1.2.002001.t1/scaffold53.1/size378684/22